jgi:hypothetical protein
LLIATGISVADWLASARRQFGRANTITLRRIGTPDIDITVHAKARAYEPDELVGGINQQDREIRILAEDVTFSPALRPGDKAIIAGADDEHRLSGCEHWPRWRWFGFLHRAGEGLMEAYHAEKGNEGGEKDIQDDA